jgi:type II secretory pathway component PulC
MPGSWKIPPEPGNDEGEIRQQIQLTSVDENGGALGYNISFVLDNTQ